MACVYTQCDKRFSGNLKYPLPSGRAVDNKIGKGGNGFVFVIYHERRQYAVKKVNETNDVIFTYNIFLIVDSVQIQ